MADFFLLIAQQTALVLQCFSGEPLGQRHTTAPLCRTYIVLAIRMRYFLALFIVFIRTYLFLHFPTYVMPPPPPTVVAVAAFANMFSVGTVFAPSTVQFELPGCFQTSRPPSLLCPLRLPAWGCPPAPVAAPRRSRAWAVTQARLSAPHFGSRHSLARATFCNWAPSQSTRVFWIYWLPSHWVALESGWLTWPSSSWSARAQGQGLPDQLLARSAIGPLGFSSGSAAFVALLRLPNVSVIRRMAARKMCLSLVA